MPRCQEGASILADGKPHDRDNSTVQMTGLYGYMDARPYVTYAL